MHYYFIEFEFKSPSGAVYWFPLCVNAKSRAEAEDVRTRFSVGLKEAKYVIQSERGPSLVIGGINSEQIDSYRAGRMTGKLAILEVLRYQVRGVDDDPVVSVDDRFRVAIEEHPLKIGESIAKVKQYQFSVKVVLPSNYCSSDEYLIMNVSSPPDPSSKIEAQET